MPENSTPPATQPTVSAPAPTTPPGNPIYLFQSYHLSEKFVLRNLDAVFQSTPIASDLSRVAFKNRAGDGYFFIFNFGTVCFFNTSKEEQKQLTDMLATKYPMLTHGKEWDDFAVDITSGKRQQVRVYFNKVTMNALSFERVDVIALMLAESVTLDFYEGLADDLLEKSFVTAEVLTKTGRLPGSNRDINRSIGLSMSTKQLIVSNLYLLDKPDVIWENEILEKLYRGLFRNFEMRERFMAIEFKLKTLQDNMALIGSLINNRKAEHLEMTIVILIVIEIILFSYEIFIR